MRGACDARTARRVARALAELHEGSASSEDVAGWGSVEALATRVHRAAEEASGKGLGVEAADSARARLIAELHQQGDLFHSRVLRARVRGSCGRLRWEGVRETADAAIDFDRGRPAQPGSDVCADLAGITRDLQDRGEALAAEALLAAYAEACDDYGFYPLLGFYRALRSLEEGRPIEPDRPSPAAPLLVVTCGLVGCGKSSVARWAAERCAVPRIEADRVRASLLEDPPVEPVLGGEWERSCAPGFVDAVYAEVFRRAEQVLSSGRGAVLDGCFRSRTQRHAALELAGRHGFPAALFECRLDERRLLARLRARDRERGRRPGTWPEILDAMAAEWEPIEDLPEDAHAVLDTSQPEHETRSVVEAHLARLTSRSAPPTD
jgi:predicted kinase